MKCFNALLSRNTFLLLATSSHVIVHSNGGFMCKKLKAIKRTEMLKSTQKHNKLMEIANIGGANGQGFTQVFNLILNEFGWKANFKRWPTSIYR